jgi:hypothetical protein
VLLLPLALSGKSNQTRRNKKWNAPTSRGVSSQTRRRATARALRGAAPPEVAEPLYEAFCATLAEAGVEVAHGVFGARMHVELVNDGPVTIVL